MSHWTCRDCLSPLNVATLRTRIEDGRLLCLCPEHERRRRERATAKRLPRFPLALVLLFLTCVASGGIAFLTEYMR